MLGVPCSTRALVDGSPACLWFVEDAGGENCAWARRHLVPGTVDVLEIHGPDDWIRLCRRFPLEVAAAGTAIDVDGDTASVIAGWAPDETFWLTDDVHADGDIVEWAYDANYETWSVA